MEKNYDYRTEGTKKREALHEKVASLYVTYRSSASAEVSDNQIFNRIASECNISSVSARNICIGKGVATAKKS